MNYKSETLMAWITYVRAGVWKLADTYECTKDPDLIIDKFEDLMKDEFVSECNEVSHNLIGTTKLVGPITVFINEETKKYTLYDNYNTVMCVHNGIYMEFDGLKLCIDTQAHGFPDVDNRYFKYCKTSDDRFVSIKSIVEGTCNNDSQNVRRLISILYSRYFQSVESINVENRIFMDYTEEEKEKILKDCVNYIGKTHGKKPKGIVEE